MTLTRLRQCDGQCCREMPLRPVEGGGDCYFRDPSNPERGCTVMSDPSRTREMTPDEREYFKVACLNWPHNTTPDIQPSFGGCCWGYEDAG